MNEVRVTMELCGEDRKRLDAILEAMLGSTHNCEGCVQAALKMAGVGKNEPQEEADPVVEEDNAPEPESAPEPEKRVEIGDIQQKVVTLSAAGKKDKVRAIVKSYAERVLDIPADKLGEVWDKLQALENEE